MDRARLRASSAIRSSYSRRSLAFLASLSRPSWIFCHSLAWVRASSAAWSSSFRRRRASTASFKYRSSSSSIWVDCLASYKQKGTFRRLRGSPLTRYSHRNKHLLTEIISSACWIKLKAYCSEADLPPLFPGGAFIKFQIDSRSGCDDRFST
jgi:hypothetical protein